MASDGKVIVVVEMRQNGIYDAPAAIDNSRFRVKPTTPFFKIARMWCDRFGQISSDWVFLYENSRIMMTDTIETLEIDEDDDENRIQAVRVTGY